MDRVAIEREQAGPSKARQAGKRIVPWLIALLVVTLTVGLFIFAQRYPDKVRELASFGYAGVFIVSLVSSATLILPVPGVLVILPLVMALSPLLVALAASTGGILGELSGYMAGYSGHGLIHRRGMHLRAERWIRRWGTWTILLFAAVPLVPFDIAGLLAGALRYPLWRFMLIGWAGKSLKFIALVFATRWGLEFLLRFLS